MKRFISLAEWQDRIWFILNKYGKIHIREKVDLHNARDTAISYKILFLFIIINSVLMRVDCQTWQEVLEGQFDIVETFDQLQDWSGPSIGYDYKLSHQPKKQGGAYSIWQFHMSDFGKNASASDWISDHGAYSWNRSGSSTPKSLCLQHNVLYTTADDSKQGWGAQRLGTFWGNRVTGKSGYKKIYLFLMVKFRPGYFALRQDGDYAYIGYLKFFDICSGFTDMGTWGTASDRTGTSGTPQMLQEYGANFTVMNWQSGGTTYGGKNLFPFETSAHASTSNPSYPGVWHYLTFNQQTISTSGLSIAPYYENNKWMGFEIALDIGAVGKSDGTIDIWMYDDEGNENGHYSAAAEPRLVHFDHYFNKIVLGGNRSMSTGEDAVVPSDTRAYIDDIIIDSNRVGPKYFELLQAGGQASQNNSSGGGGCFISNL